MHDRCSQETRNKQTHTTATHPTKNGERGRAMVLLPQDPTVCQTPPGGSFRRAFQDRHPQGGTDPYLLPACAARHLFVDIPPVSTRRRTIVCATGVLLTTPPHPHTRGKVAVGAP